jgi:exopolysaccharide biosynthesis predicted pyruvyltransferase EpsI
MIRFILILSALMSIPLSVFADDNCDKAKEYYQDGIKLLHYGERKVVFDKAVKLCPT